MADGSNIITVDFKNAPPSNGAQTDRVEPGHYTFRVTKVESVTARSGRPMVVASFVVASGPERNKRMVERFALPQKEGDSLYGAQRLHAFFVACGAEMGEKKVKVNLNTFVGKSFSADVQDDVQEESTDPVSGRVFPRRTGSKIAEYDFGEPKASKAKPAAPVDDDDDDDEDEAPPVTSSKKKAAPAPVDDDDDDDDDDDEDDAPPPIRSSKKKPAPVVDDDDDDDEDPDTLFDA